MFNVKVLNNVSDIICDNLPKEQYIVGKDIDNPNGIILRSANLHDMDFPQSLLAIARAGAGVNNIPLDKCTKQGIVVFNTPGANANAVAELALASLLISSRKIYQGISWAKSLSDSDDDISKLIEKGKSRFAGPEIKGKSLGIIGLGAIGVLVANNASALGMKVTGYDPYISVKSAWHISRAINHAADIDSLLKDSDYITIHIPLTEDTKNMINKESLAKMKKGVRLLNFSRGGLVNTEDVVDALKDGRVACYVTDFPTKEMLAMENVIPIPHLGASTPESEDNCAEMASFELKNFLETGNITNSVNFPNCEMQKTDAHRITIAHNNVPNMVGQIASVLATQSINISNMINKSRGQVAYTIIDIDGVAPIDIVNKLNEIDGTIKTRVLY